MIKIAKKKKNKKEGENSFDAALVLNLKDGTKWKTSMFSKEHVWKSKEASLPLPKLPAFPFSDHSESTQTLRRLPGKGQLSPQDPEEASSQSRPPSREVGLHTSSFG